MRRSRAVAAAVLTPFVLLAATEAIARLAFAAPQAAWIPHPFVGRVRPPNLSLERVSLEDGSTFRFETNALGLRGRSIAGAEKPAGTYRIFFVGASTTENPNLPEEKTFPAIVERLLAAKLGGAPRVEVGNAGISGGDTDSTLANLAHRLLPLHPDLVVALEGNDFFESLREDWEPTTYYLARSRPPRFTEWLVASSRFLGVLDASFGGGMERDPRPQYRRRAKKRHDRPFVDPPPAVFLRGRDRFRENLGRMALLCDDAGAVLCLMTVAWLYKPEQPPDEDAVIWQTDPAASSFNLTTAAARRGADAYNEIVRSVARERGALLVDLDAAVPHDLVNLVDDVHLSVAGNERAARAIVDGLLASGALPRPRR
ncbi:MAG TPA: SGNH/GDSL hydrolase family protein [Planctomycetota bacterium]|nr:SGNH/GDSL hydrolase family protein [Planctomycetota bacterium]